MSDTKILSAEEIASRTKLNDSVWVGEILRSHALVVAQRDAALQRAEQVEAVCAHLGSWQSAQGYFFDLTNPEAEVQPLLDLLTRIKEALPPERAREYSEALAPNGYLYIVQDLRAYADALEGVKL